MTETPWQQYERLAYTECRCGHWFIDHGKAPNHSVCNVSQCDCVEAEPAQ